VQGGTVTVPALSGTYLIRAVGYWGQPSKTPAQLFVSDISVFGLNVVKAVAEEPEFSGVKSGSLTLDGDLLLLGPAGNQAGEYSFGEVVDLGGVYASRVSADIHAFGYLAAFVMSAWPRLSLVESLNGLAGEDAWSVMLMMQTTRDDPADPQGVWSAWDEFRAGDHEARGYRFRLDVASYDVAVQVAVSRLHVTIDMPDRVAGQKDINSPAGGVYVSFDTAFKERPALSVTGHDLPVASAPRITLQSNSGFQLQFVDAFENGVACTFDWVAVGYGRET
jgi:hypothetical protein